MNNLLSTGLAKKAIVFAFIVGLISPSAFAYTDQAPVNLGSTPIGLVSSSVVDLSQAGLQAVSPSVDLGQAGLVAAVAPSINALGVTPSTGSALIYFNVSTAAKATVWVKDMSDNIVKTLTLATDLVPNQTYQYTWNGTDSGNAAVAAGTYKAVVLAYNSVSSDVQSSSFSFTTGSVTPPATTAPTLSSVSVSPTFFDPNTSSATISFTVDKAVTGSVTILDGSTIIRTLANSQSLPAGVNSFTWNGRDASGNVFPNKVYNANIYVSNSGGYDTRTSSVEVRAGSTTTAPVLSNVYATPSTFDPNSTNTSIYFTVDKAATVSLNIMNGSTTTRNLLNSSSLASGTYFYQWNGRDSSGNIVSNGTYSAKVDASNAGGPTSQSASVQVSTSGTGGTCSLITSNYANPSTFTPGTNDVQISYNLNRAATVTVKVLRYTSEIKTLISTQSQGSGNNSVYWNGRNLDGTYVSNGSYNYEIRASVSGCADDVQTGSIYATNSTGDNSYVSDWPITDAGLITNLTVNPEVFNPNNGQRTNISFYLSHSAKTRVEILDGTTVIKTLNNSNSSYVSGGNMTYTWDGRDNNGNRLSDRVLQVRAMADDGSRTDTDRAYLEIDTDGIIIGFPTSAQCAGFRDVSTNSPFCKAIQLMSKKNIFDGYSDGTFRPYQKINRAETAKVVVLAMGYDVPTGTYFGRQYNDTSANAWYAPYLDVAKKNGIATGYPDGSFRPANTINRVELLRVFLEANSIRPSTCSPAPFEDTPITSDTNWYMKYACYAKQNGLMGSDNSNKLYPADDMTRGDVANLFYDFEVKGLYTNFNNNGLFNNSNNGNTTNNNCTGYYNSNGVYVYNTNCTNNNNVNNNNCSYSANGTYTCNGSTSTYNCGYNTNGIYTCNNSNVNSSNCYYNTSGVYTCSTNSNNNTNGYYTYRNGVYQWVTY